MSLKPNRTSKPPSLRLEPTRDRQEAPALSITVVYTSVPATSAALKAAGTLAESLSAAITLVVPFIVPYPLPLSNPPIPVEFQELRLRELAEKSQAQVQAQVCLCRDAFEALTKTLSPHSVVIVGGRKRWWQTRESRLARQLQRAGHEVIFTDVSEKSSRGSHA